MLFLFLIHTVWGDACRSYKTIDDSSRNVDNRVYNKGANTCDKDLATGWYRFTASGNTMIPRNVVPIRRCGGAATGWQDFSNPTRVGQITSGNMAFHWGKKTRTWKAPAKAKLCQESSGTRYYVYHLQKTPVCDLRYCTKASPHLEACTLSSWTAWGACSKECDSGVQKRSRSVTRPAKNGGKCGGAREESRKCNVQKCPVNCELSEWTTWNECSKKCGGGKQKRLRHIKKEAKHGGTCTGELEESKDCNMRECTQHDAVVEHVDVVESMIDAVAKSHSGMDKSVAQVADRSNAVAAVKTKAIADLKSIRDKLTAMKGKLNDKKMKLGKEDSTITEALSELKARWTKLNSQQAEKLKSAEEKRAAHEKKIKTMLSNMERQRRRLQLAGAM